MNNVNTLTDSREAASALVETLGKSNVSDTVLIQCLLDLRKLSEECEQEAIA